MIYNIVEEAEDNLREWLAENATQVRAEKAGLDGRVGNIWIADDAIICETYNVGRLEYYGGFEYVDKEQRSQIGNLVIYYANDDRVMEAIEWFNENEEG